MNGKPGTLLGGDCVGTRRQPVSDSTVVVTSLTHLRVDENHPLAERIRAYQRKRSARIAVSNGQGPSPPMLDPRLRRKNQKRLRKHRR